MYDITLYFKNSQPLCIQLDDNSVARQWKNLFQKNLALSLPINKSFQNPSIEKLIELVNEANQKLKWNFANDIKTLDDTVLLHKHIEEICANGFNSIPAQYDDLIHNIHECIHNLESSFLGIDNAPPHDGIFTLEWFNDDGFALDKTFDHTLNLEIGQIKLQNPYVGHSPLQVYRTNDFSNIAQTCRFHDFVRPGLSIVTGVHNRNKFSLSHYIKWWKTNAPEFIKNHGLEKILHYTGHPIIGRVVNIDNLNAINEQLEGIEVI